MVARAPLWVVQVQGRLGWTEAVWCRAAGLVGVAVVRLPALALTQVRTNGVDDFAPLTLHLFLVCVSVFGYHFQHLVCMCVSADAPPHGTISTALHSPVVDSAK